MTIGLANNMSIHNPLLHKTKIKFVINDDIKKQVVNVDTNEVIREVPHELTSQILKNLYG